MKNQDTLIKQFQKAAENAPLQKAPAHDAIWDKIESRLDKKALTTKKQLWKRIALAACFLLVGSLLFQWFQSPAPVTSTASVTIQDTIQNSVASAPTPSDTITPTVIKPEANALLKKQIETSEVVVNETPPPPPVAQHDATTEVIKKSKGMPFKNRVFDARGVAYTETDADGVSDKQVTPQNLQKAPPLFILDSKAITGASKNYKSTTESELYATDDIESVTYLPNPLYIINGVEYTEKELFGPQPTSPYYPINDQDITDTKILQGDQATTAYGNKGANGVVIITTKNGKPKPIKQKNK